MNAVKHAATTLREEAIQAHIQQQLLLAKAENYTERSSLSYGRVWLENAAQSFKYKLASFGGQCASVVVTVCVLSPSLFFVLRRPDSPLCPSPIKMPRLKLSSLVLALPNQRAPCLWGSCRSCSLRLWTAART